MTAIFPAKYPGQCAACDERIKEGDQIMYDDDGTLIHAHCEPTGFDDAGKACPKCWLVHAGECF